MSWAIFHIENLKKGQTVSFWSKGNSMKPLIFSGDKVIVEPIKFDTRLKVNDIVLCKVNGRHYLHLIKAVQGSRYQIGNNRGRINGWISSNSIFGICVKVEGK